MTSSIPKSTVKYIRDVFTTPSHRQTITSMPRTTDATIRKSDFTIANAATVTCTRPCDEFAVTRYVLDDEFERHLEVTQFDVDVECKPGFWAPLGTPKAAVCNPDSGGPYAVSGCEPITCDGRIARSHGYSVLIGRGHGNADLRKYSTGRQAPNQAFGSTLVFPCLKNYHKGTVTYTCDQTRKFVTDQVCDPVICTEPMTTGYNFTGASKDKWSLALPTFSVTGVMCALGYEGTPKSIPCHGEGNYIVTGCAAKMCSDSNNGCSSGWFCIHCVDFAHSSCFP